MYKTLLVTTHSLSIPTAHLRLHGLRRFYTWLYGLWFSTLSLWLCINAYIFAQSGFRLSVFPFLRVLPSAAARVSVCVSVCVYLCPSVDARLSARQRRSLEEPRHRRSGAVLPRRKSRCRSIDPWPPPLPWATSARPIGSPSIKPGLRKTGTF